MTFVILCSDRAALSLSRSAVKMDSFAAALYPQAVKSRGPFSHPRAHATGSEGQPDASGRPSRVSPLATRPPNGLKPGQSVGAKGPPFSAEGEISGAGTGAEQTRRGKPESEEELSRVDPGARRPYGWSRTIDFKLRWNLSTHGWLKPADI